MVRNNFKSCVFSCGQGGLSREEFLLRGDYSSYRMS